MANQLEKQNQTEVSLQNSQILDSPALQTQVAEAAHSSLTANGYHPDSPDVNQIVVDYPAFPSRNEIAIYVLIELKVTSLFSELDIIENGVISG